jgi:bifunctional DNase/RNase
MYKRIYFIALVPNLRFGIRRHTIYLFNKEEKIVLPVEIKNLEALMFLTGRTHLDESVPHLYIFIKNLLKYFEAKLVSITVFNCSNGLFCSHLNLLVDEKHLELPLGFTDAFVLSKLFDTPIYAHHKLLDERGIKVSREILKDALRE